MFNLVSLVGLNPSLDEQACQAKTRQDKDNVPHVSEPNYRHVCDGS